MSISKGRGAQEPVAAQPGYQHGAGFLLATLGAMGERRWVAHLRTVGLQRSEYGILAVLHETDGALRQREVARRVGIDPRNVVPIVASLVTRGLLVQAPDPYDARAKLVQITSRGTHTMRTLGSLLAGDRDDFFAALEPGEYQALVTLLRRVYEANIIST